MWSRWLEARTPRQLLWPRAANRQAVALVTDLEPRRSQRLVAARRGRAGPARADLDEAFRFDQSGSHDGQFVNIHNPPLRLVIIGAVHIAQAVIPMAQQLGL